MPSISFRAVYLNRLSGAGLIRRKWRPEKGEETPQAQMRLFPSLSYRAGFFRISEYSDFKHLAPKKDLDFRIIRFQI
jgi:hypothetical protein